MTRKELEELGYSEEQVNQLMDLNGKAIEKVKKERDEAIAKATGAEEELVKREKDFKELQDNSGASEELKKQLEERNAEYEEYKANALKREEEFKEQSVLGIVVAKSGTIDETSYKANLDLDKARSHEKGFEEGLLEQHTQLKESKSFLFGDSLNEGLGHGKPVPKEISLKDVLYGNVKKEV